MEFLVPHHSPCEENLRPALAGWGTALASGLLLAGHVAGGEPVTVIRPKPSLITLRPRIVVPGPTAQAPHLVKAPAVESPASGLILPTAGDVLPPLPAGGDLRALPTGDVGADGFPMSGGYVPGQTSVGKPTDRTPDRGGVATFARFGRQGVPLIVADADWGVARLLP